MGYEYSMAVNYTTSTKSVRREALAYLHRRRRRTSLHRTSRHRTSRRRRRRHSRLHRSCTPRCCWLSDGAERPSGWYI